MIKKFILGRLKEASTYRGLLVIAGIFGASFDPSQTDAIITACIAIYGVMAVFLPNVFGEKPQPVPAPKGVPDPTTRVQTSSDQQTPDALGDGEIKPKWNGKTGGQFP